ncbi:MAG: MBL fold metallo-hydrolase [Desulfarculaceae bacterium]|nr:MBL fold metallo-hydrolase [Desulfarculaceae bacterium]MCF8099214.1 MBL fold metallo-hydrolase [Desulfarculaceae bacterium]
MIQISEHGPVTCFKMGRDMGGQVMYWCAAYLVGDVLIDSGCVHTAPELAQALTGRKVRAVVNTHHHEDHIGGNALLAQRLGVELYAPAAALERLAAPEKELYPYQMLMWGPAPASRPQPLGGEVRAGDFRLEVMPAPGHSDDLVVYYEPHQGWAFVSDLWVAPRQKTSRDHENSRQILAAQKALAARSPKVMFTGMGDVVAPAAPALSQSIAFLEEMAAKVDELAAKGMEPPRMVEELFGRESSLMTMTQGQLSYENFVRSFLKGA